MRPRGRVMAVVKADGYGHGLVPSARAALAGGATWLGTAVLEEALALRAAGHQRPGPDLAASPGVEWEPVRAPGSTSRSAHRSAWRRSSRPRQRCRSVARVHLEADTGLSRGGATVYDWPALVDAALRAQAAGDARLTGLWSHLACADEPEHPANAEQLDRFTDMLATARAMGARPEVRHLANSAATFQLPDTRFDLVRAGIAVYGLAPAPRSRRPPTWGSPRP